VSDKLVLTSVTPASSAPVLQTPKATSSTLYFDSLTVNAGNGGFLHCIQMDTSVNAANQVVSVGADIAFDADPKFFACLVRFESSSVPTTLPTDYDVYPLDGRHDGGYYTVKDCVTIVVLPRTPGNNVYVGFMVWSNFTATKCRGLVSLNQDRKSGSAGMPRPISYAVFCLKKKIFFESRHYPTRLLSICQRHQMDASSIHQFNFGRWCDGSVSGLWRYNSARVYSLRASTHA